MRITPPVKPYPRRLTVRLTLPRKDEKRFSDLQFSAALFWTMLDGNGGIDFILDIPAGVERDGNTLILDKAEDLPKHARVFGLIAPLPLEIVGGDHVWVLRFYRYGSFDVFAVNDIPVAVLGTDAEVATPLPRSAYPYAVAWAASETLEGLEGSSYIRQLQVQSSAPMPLKFMEGLRFMRNLQHLEFIGNSVGEMPAGFLPESLKSLTVNLPEGVENLECLSHLTDLESLTITRCRSLKDLGALENFQGIRDLRILGASSLTDISAIGSFCWIRTVDLSGASALECLRPLSFLEGVERLTLAHCDSVRSLWPLAVLENLQFLDLTGCSKINSLLPLRALPLAEVVMPDRLG